jgi:glc operon protein GlcG
LQNAPTDGYDHDHAGKPNSLDRWRSHFSCARLIITKEPEMDAVIPTARLTHTGAMAILSEAVAYAEKISVPVAVSICDQSGMLLVACRMTGSNFLSVEASLHKAMTAAATAKPTGWAPESLGVRLGVATSGRMTVSLLGGLPIIVDGEIVGGIGAGSGTGEQDREICLNALKALAGTKLAFE